MIIKNNNMLCPVKVTHPVLTKCQNGSAHVGMVNTGVPYWQLQVLRSGIRIFPV